MPFIPFLAVLVLFLYVSRLLQPQPEPPTPTEPTLGKLLDDLLDGKKKKK